jgi:hypothetical protein
MNFRKTYLLCAGLFTTFVVVCVSGFRLQAGHASAATGVGSVYAANVQQEPVTHRQPLSLRMLARVLHDCDQKGKPIHPGLVRWASRALSSEEGQNTFQKSGDQLFGRPSFQSISSRTN